MLPRAARFWRASALFLRTSPASQLRCVNTSEIGIRELDMGLLDKVASHVAEQLEIVNPGTRCWRAFASCRKIFLNLQLHAVCQGRVRFRFDAGGDKCIQTGATLKLLTLQIPTSKADPAGLSSTRKEGSQGGRASCFHPGPSDLKDQTLDSISEGLQDLIACQGLQSPLANY
eukprot:1139306-Pelagomonas_calceolata.AAC.3